MDRTRDQASGKTFAHVWLTPDLAAVLGAIGGDASLESEQTGFLETGGVGDDVLKEVLEAVALWRDQCRRKGRERRTKGYLEDRRDVYMVGVGNADEHGLGGGGLLELADGPNHGGVL